MGVATQVVALLTNAHRWRWVYEVDKLDDDAHAGMAGSLSVGFRVLRVSDDQPDQGPQYEDMVIAVHELDLVDVQVRTEHVPHQRPDQTGTATSTGGESDQPASMASRSGRRHRARRHGAGVQPQYRHRQR